MNEFFMKALDAVKGVIYFANILVQNRLGFICACVDVNNRWFDKCRRLFCLYIVYINVAQMQNTRVRAAGIIFPSLFFTQRPLWLGLHHTSID